ncbi:hypothetical protein AB0M36_00725 [Actinoplanes sp. NPDC051346]|uniref:hypothetical protein n=1 Tax=Actinoplanes sp. NPDC051346 TaxID=3155048 RepID=UPI00343D4FE0
MTHPWSPPPGGGRPDIRPVPAPSAGPHQPAHPVASPNPGPNPGPGFGPNPGPGFGPNLGPGFGPGHPWPGQPGGPPPGYLVPVPRPPKPFSVRVAMILTWVGLALSGLLTVAVMVYLWIVRAELSTGDGWVAYIPSLLTVLLVVVPINWLLPAVGIMINAVKAGRGKNSARVALVCLLGYCVLTQGGVFLNGLFSGAEALASSAGADYDWDLMSGLPVVFVAVQGICVLLALGIGILLLVPATNRYFSPGPGKRFLPEA